MRRALGWTLFVAGWAVLTWVFWSSPEVTERQLWLRHWHLLLPAALVAVTGGILAANN